VRSERRELVHLQFLPLRTHTQRSKQPSRTQQSTGTSLRRRHKSEARSSTRTRSRQTQESFAQRWSGGNTDRKAPTAGEKRQGHQLNEGTPTSGSSSPSSYISGSGSADSTCGGTTRSRTPREAGYDRPASPCVHSSTLVER
jgi:hypothetical protein